jgi:hypothetical protein
MFQASIEVKVNAESFHPLVPISVGYLKETCGRLYMFGTTQV